MAVILLYIVLIALLLFFVWLALQALRNFWRWLTGRGGSGGWGLDDGYYSDSTVDDVPHHHDDPTHL